MMVERETYKNEVLGDGGGIDQRRRWRRGVEVIKSEGLLESESDRSI